MTADPSRASLERESDLPEGSSLANEESGASQTFVLNDHNAEEIRLAHDKDSHIRERTLFLYAMWIIALLFVFGMAFASFALYAIAHGTTPWLITLASISILTPAVLLACLFQHVYSKNQMDMRIVNQLIDRAPVMELVKNISDWIQNVIVSKK